MTEKFYAAYCVDNNRRTIRPVFMKAEEVERINSYGGLANTPMPINFIDLNQPKGYHAAVEINDIYVAFAFNKKGG